MDGALLTELGSGGAGAPCKAYGSVTECPLDCWWCEDTAICVADWHACDAPQSGGWASATLSVGALALFLGLPVFLCARGLSGQLDSMPPPPTDDLETYTHDECMPGADYHSGCPHEELQLVPLSSHGREPLGHRQDPEPLSGQRLLNWS
mmetsp:Transcript_5517/g.12169  ORF Transcript_5517/g.12169 Transcript_5517/m.12169 type:complete len:150 (-) Transcript_5517:724-1173(-)